MLEKIDLELKLKIMYIYTIIAVGGFGLWVLIAPDSLITILSMPNQDKVTLGISGAVWLTFAILSILGLFNPHKYIPVLLFQMLYKLIWILAVFIPNVITRGAEFYTIFTMIIFLTFIIGDILVIPFKDVFKLKPE